MSSATKYQPSPTSTDIIHGPHSHSSVTLISQVPDSPSVAKPQILLQPPESSSQGTLVSKILASSPG